MEKGCRRGEPQGDMTVEQRQREKQSCWLGRLRKGIMNQELWAASRS